MANLKYTYGAMGAGKTTILINTADSYERKGLSIQLYKPKKDIKGEDTIVNRQGLSKKVDVLLDSNDVVYDYIDCNVLPNAIFVDEAQFITLKQVDEFYNISKDLDIPVLAYGLRTDFQMDGFEAAARLLLIADESTEIMTICQCGNKATQNIRLLDGIPVFEGDKIVIDGESPYEYDSVCGDCYLKMSGRTKKIVYGRKR